MELQYKAGLSHTNRLMNQTQDSYRLQRATCMSLQVP